MTADARQEQEPTPELKAVRDVAIQLRVLDSHYSASIIVADLYKKLTALATAVNGCGKHFYNEQGYSLHCGVEQCPNCRDAQYFAIRTLLGKTEQK